MERIGRFGVAIHPSALKAALREFGGEAVGLGHGLHPYFGIDLDPDQSVVFLKVMVSVLNREAPLWVDLHSANYVDPIDDSGDCEEILRDETSFFTVPASMLISDLTVELARFWKPLFRETCLHMKIVSVECFYDINDITSSWFLIPPSHYVPRAAKAVNECTQGRTAFLFGNTAVLHISQGLQSDTAKRCTHMLTY